VSVGNPIWSVIAPMPLLAPVVSTIFDVSPACGAQIG
jgi:hypothetical protein